LVIWDITNRSDRSPVEIGAMLSTGSIAASCSSRICWASFVAKRTTPGLLALGPALHPIGERCIAIVLGSRHFCILPTSLAMLITAPLLLLGRPPCLPIEEAIRAIERVNRTLRSGRSRTGRRIRMRTAWNEASRTTTRDLIRGPVVLVVVLVNEALLGRGPEEPGEQPQGQQQASQRREDEATQVAGGAARRVFTTVTNILQCWCHGKLALAVAYIHQVIRFPRVTRGCRAIHVCKQPRKSARVEH